MNDAIGFALIHAAHRVEARLDEALAGVGLSGAKIGALCVLVAEDRPMSLSELAEKLTCVRSNVTQLVDRLEADGLVKRTDDPADRRVVRAEVTAARTATACRRGQGGQRRAPGCRQGAFRGRSPGAETRAGRRPVSFLTKWFMHESYNTEPQTEGD